MSDGTATLVTLMRVSMPNEITHKVATAAADATAPAAVPERDL